MDELFLVEAWCWLFSEKIQSKDAIRATRVETMHPTYTPLLGEPVTKIFCSISSNNESQFEYVVAESGLPFLK